MVKFHCPSLKMIQLAHPNFIDRLAVKIYPRYLYPGQICASLADVNVGIIHKLPDVKQYWKIMDYLYLKKGSVMKFLGLAKNLNIIGDVQPLYTIMELIIPKVDEKKSFGKQLSKGDLISLTPYDRQFLVASPADVLTIQPPVYTNAD